MTWILICKHCKFGEKICYNSRYIEFFLGDYFFRAPCTPMSFIENPFPVVIIMLNSDWMQCYHQDAKTSRRANLRTQCHCCKCDIYVAINTIHAGYHLRWRKPKFFTEFYWLEFTLLPHCIMLCFAANNEHRQRWLWEILLQINKPQSAYITTTPTRRLASHAVIFQQELQKVTEVLFTTLRSCRQHCSDVSGVPYRNEECQNIKIWHSNDVMALL